MLFCNPHIYWNTCHRISIYVRLYIQAYTCPYMTFRKTSCQGKIHGAEIIGIKKSEITKYGVKLQYPVIRAVNIRDERGLRMPIRTFIEKKTGKETEARKLFKDIMRNIKVSPKYCKRIQREWCNIAKNEI